MTVTEAAQLVIQAGAMGEGGDVFVLDMGEPVNIFEIAKRLVNLSGMEIKDNDNSGESSSGSDLLNNMKKKIQ